MIRELFHSDRRSLSLMQRKERYRWSRITRSAVTPCDKLLAIHTSNAPRGWHMAEIPKELIRTNAILGEYVAIHDTIFKFSWRKAFPIPGLFKSTDFGAHYKALNRLASKLTTISAKLKTDSESLEGSLQYMEALLEAIQALREICRKFYEQSQGNFSRYPMAEYTADLKTYEVLMNRCQGLGVALNQHLRSEQPKSDG